MAPNTLVSPHKRYLVVVTTTVTAGSTTVTAVQPAIFVVVIVATFELVDRNVVADLLAPDGGKKPYTVVVCVTAGRVEVVVLGWQDVALVVETRVVAGEDVAFELVEVVDGLVEVEEDVVFVLDETAVEVAPAQPPTMLVTAEAPFPIATRLVPQLAP